MSLRKRKQITDAKFIGFEEGGHVFVGHEETVRAEIIKCSFRKPSPKSQIYVLARIT